MTSPFADFALECSAAALYLYPIKACAALAVSEIEIDARGGAVGDRGWAIVDADGAVTWQGARPRLALVHPRFEDDGLALHAAGFDDVATPPAPALAPCRVRIWNDLRARHDEFDAFDAGDAVAAWLERVVDAPLRLVKLEDAALAREGSNALHLVFAPSMAALDAQLAGAGLPPADPRRFRANIVLTGALDEFVEESVSALAWDGAAGPMAMEITAPCIRCIVPSVNPTSALVDESVGDALTLLSQRRRPGATVFGIYARGAAGARLRVGDTARMALAF
jgi:uncharacterized protein YcbX